MKLQEHDYKAIDLFTKRQRYIPNDRLLKYRRNVVSLGGLILLVILAGIPITNLKILSLVGIVGGDIARPYFIFIFLAIFFGYNFVMFYLYLKREIGALTFSQMSFGGFCNGVANYYLKKLLSEKVFNQRTGDIERFLDDMLSSGPITEDTIQLSVNLLPETIIKYRAVIEEISEFTMPEPGKSELIFKYTPTVQDKQFYDENKNYLKSILLHEFMDFEFPKYFGFVVVLAIFYHYMPYVISLLKEALK